MFCPSQLTYLRTPISRVVNSLLAEISCKRLRDYAPQGLQCITHVRKKSNTYRDSRVLMACVIVLNSSRFGQFIQQTLRSAGMFWQSPITLSFIGCEIRKYFSICSRARWRSLYCNVRTRQQLEAVVARNSILSKASKLKPWVESVNPTDEENFLRQ